MCRIFLATKFTTTTKCSKVHSYSLQKLALGAKALWQATKQLIKFPITITSFAQLESLCNSLSTMKICSGNNDESFLKLLDKRGGLIMNNKSVTAFLDKNPHSTTVRHINCPLICVDRESRCSSCLQYRPTLRAMHSRSEKTALTATSSTASSSHTNYRYLGSEEF